MAISPRWMGVWGLMLATLVNSRSRQSTGQTGRVRFVPFAPSWNVKWPTGIKGNLDAFLERLLELAQGGVSVRRQSVRRLGGVAPALSPKVSRRGAGDGSPRILWSRDRATCAEAVLARGRWRLTMPDGTKPAGLFTVIFRKFPEGWKIIHDHTSAEEPVQPKHRAHETVRLKSQDFSGYETASSSLMAPPHPRSFHPFAERPSCTPTPPDPSRSASPWPR